MYLCGWIWHNTKTSTRILIPSLEASCSFLPCCLFVMTSSVRSFRGHGGGGRSGSSHATNIQPSISRASISFVPPQQRSKVLLSRSSRINEKVTQPPPIAQPPIQEAMDEEPEEEAAPGPMGEAKHMTFEGRISQTIGFFFTNLTLLQTPGREVYLPILNPDLEERTTWFGQDEGRITQKLSKLLKHKFDEPYYSWSKVSPRRQDRYFIDFAAYWAIEVEQSKRSVVSNSRNSERGRLGVHKHVAGPKKYEQIQYKREEELGRLVSVGEIFVRTHTKPDGIFVDQKAKKISETYDKNVEEKSAQLQDEDFDLSDANSARLQLTTNELDVFF